jgi:hypothetical protein
MTWKLEWHDFTTAFAGVYSSCSRTISGASTSLGFFGGEFFDGALFYGFILLRSHCDHGTNTTIQGCTRVEAPRRGPGCRPPRRTSVPRRCLGPPRSTSARLFGPSSPRRRLRKLVAPRSSSSSRSPRCTSSLSLDSSPRVQPCNHPPPLHHDQQMRSPYGLSFGSLVWRVVGLVKFILLGAGRGEVSFPSPRGAVSPSFLIPGPLHLCVHSDCIFGPVVYSAFRSMIATSRLRHKRSLGFPTRPAQHH